MSEFPIVGRVPLEEYRRLMENFPVVTVDVLFFNTDKTKILLGKRTNQPYAGEFYSFGGRLYKNEDLLEAACRIAREELGIDVTPQELVFSGILNEINPSSIFEGVNYHTLDVYFAYTLDTAIAHTDNQHSETQWFPVDDVSLHSNVKARIEGALKAFA